MKKRSGLTEETLSGHDLFTALLSAVPFPFFSIRTECGEHCGPPLQHSVIANDAHSN